MGSSRSKRGRIFQTTVISLTILIVSATSSSPVQAYFNKKADQEIGIQMGSWWDGSRLGFEQADIEKPFTACSSVNLPFSIRNSGFGMIGPTGYRIYKDDKVLAEGTLGQIGENHTGHLSIQTDEPGIYYAEVDQRPGYEGNENETVRTASSIITVAECPPPPKKENKKRAEKKETNSKNMEEEGKNPAKDSEMIDQVEDDKSSSAGIPEEDPEPGRTPEELAADKGDSE
ncbi:hypothetical protein [Bacillus sp. SJS]|uniref:hypothetical protein n=1 Tax=Bacillus sp. SJS TaxID=1423321 RepID=UPI0004DD1731|nr:hypothetical protein [Bacillus sp. SJS]KZZ86279.1 hypothetical protein AS29_001535 [Bacillus sp. SJS]